jgi:hypothetical protein
MKWPDLIEEFANRPREVHAIANGFFMGFYGLELEPTTEDGQKEPHYWRAGYLVGDVTHAVLTR